jgi:hypothetical protein
MLDEYQGLVAANKHLIECKTKAGSRQSVAELQNWLIKEAPESTYGKSDLFIDISGFDRDDIVGFILPEAGMSRELSIES